MRGWTRLAAAAVLWAALHSLGLDAITPGVGPAWAQDTHARSVIGIVRIDPKDQLVIEGRGEPGGHVTVTLDGKSLGSVRVGASGRWSMTASIPPTGLHHVSVRGNGTDTVNIAVHDRTAIGTVTLYKSASKMRPPAVASKPPVPAEVQAQPPTDEKAAQAKRRQEAQASAARQLAELERQRMAAAQSKQLDFKTGKQQEAGGPGGGAYDAGKSGGGGGTGGGSPAPTTTPPGQSPMVAAPAPSPPPPPTTAPSDKDEAAGARGLKPATQQAAPATAPPRPMIEAAKEAAKPAAKPEPFIAYPVFFGTNRNRENDRPRNGATLASFGGDLGNDLLLGRADVTIPSEHKLGGVERPEWTLLGYTVYSGTEDPAKHFTLKQVKISSEAEFLSEVKDRLKASKVFKDRAFVFVHGYNVGFDSALYRTAQMGYDLSFDGAAFLFSWPSKGDYLGYIHDKDLALASRNPLRRFIELVLSQTGAKHVDLIAHSMGNLPMIEALSLMQNDLRASGKALSPETTNIDQIILAAPDVPRTTFEEQIAGIAKLGRGVTLYASSKDRALQAANTLSRGLVRAGEVPEPPLGPLVMGAVLDTIDVTATSTDFFSLNHSGFAERSPLINDIALILRTGQHPPDQRSPVLRTIQAKAGTYWQYPK